MTEKEIKQQFKNIASKNIPYDRAYLDISDSFADAVFDFYDASDLYMYLTNKERKSAYADMRGFGANSKQIQYEWMKKAIWRIADKKAWDELECWDDLDDEDDLEEMKMSDLKEAKSKWLTAVEKANKSAVDLYDYRNQLVGAVGSGELEDIVVGVMKTATAYLRFVYDVLLNADDSVSESDSVKRAMGNLFVATGKVKMLESVEGSEVYVDPYEAEYMPESMITGEVKAIKEDVYEDVDALPDDLDDDPDAVFSLNDDGMPVKFNNTPMDLDPFAVKLFRNNSELIDPPEIFNPEKGEEDKEDEDQPEVTDQQVDQVISAVADGTTEIETSDVDVVPSDDFDVFATESKIVKSRVVPKTTPQGLPPQFDAKMANDNIAEDPKNNLKMLSFLTQDW